jgi:hypothetical protein
VGDGGARGRVAGAAAAENYQVKVRFGHKGRGSRDLL